MGRNHGGRYKLVAVRERTEVPCFLTSHMDGCQSGLLSFFAKEMLLQNNHRFKSCTILHLFLGSSMVEHLAIIVLSQEPHGKLAESGLLHRS